MEEKKTKKIIKILAGVILVMNIGILISILVAYFSLGIQYSFLPFLLSFLLSILGIIATLGLFYLKERARKLIIIYLLINILIYILLILFNFCGPCLKISKGEMTIVEQIRVIFPTLIYIAFYIFLIWFFARKKTKELFKRS